MYILYLALCIFSFFYVFGFVANRKRKAINNKLKEKKQYDITSGREAAIAAMESKQILDVTEEETDANLVNPNATLSATVNANASGNGQDTNAQKEEVPTVMVLNSSDQQTSEQAPAQQPVQGETAQAQQPAVQEPLVIDSSSVQQ